MRPARLILVGFLTLAMGELVLGQPHRPAGAGRVVRVFDFEERAFTTEPVPTHWVRLVHLPGRIERPGFPAWNESGFDDQAPHEGRFSVKLPTRGGSAALRLAAGVVPVVPQADYMVRAHARTIGLSHARARLAARFLDGELREIPASEAISPLLRTDGDWTEVSVELWGDYPNAAWVQIDLLLLQPSEQEGALTSSDPDLLSDDLRGGAWFDTVEIMQLPRVEISTNARTNVVLAPDAPALLMRVRDLTGEELTGEVEVRDLHGRVVAEHRVELPPAAPTVEWVPGLDRFGWYIATLRARSGGEVIGSSAVSFVWAPAEAPEPADAPRFLIVARDEPLDRLGMLPELLERSGFGGVSISVPDLDPGVFLPPLEAAIMQAFEQRLRVSLQLGRLPASLARRLHLATDDVLDISLDSTSDAWTSFIEPALARFGQRVNRWQLGDTRDDRTRRPNLVERRLAFQSAFERLSPEPVIATPWSAFVGLDPEVVAFGSLTVALPPAMPGSGTPDLARAWDATDPEADITLLIEPPAVDAAGRVRELAVRTLHAWDTSIDRIAYRAPWRWSTDRRPLALPDPELGVLRTLAWRLHGRELVGRMPMPDGAYALILRGTNSDSLVVWNEYAPPSAAVLETYLGSGRVAAYDLFGNEVPLVGTSGRTRIESGFDPVFIENVDGDLLLLQASMRIDPGFVVSRGARRELELVVRNPWPDLLTGRVRLTGAEHWRLTPRVQPITVEAGGEVRLPFEISLGVAEEAGSHTLGVEAELNVGRDLYLLTLEARLEIGLDNLTLEGGVRIAPSPSGGADDVVVVAMITNVGEVPVTFTVAALGPGLPRKQAPVSSLAPGDSAVRQFRFEHAAPMLRGQVVRLSVIEAEGAERLNRTLDVP